MKCRNCTSFSRKVLQENEDNGADGSVDIKQVRNALSEVKKEYDEIVRKIKQNNPSYAEMVITEPVKLTDIQSRIDPGDGSSGVLDK